MSKWFGKQAEIFVDITDPPVNYKYSPIYPNIKGKVFINFIETLKKVSHIRCGIAGTADILYSATDLQYGAFQSTAINRQLITQSINFYNFHNDLPLDCKDCCNEKENGVNNNNNNNGTTLSFTFEEGEKINYNFEFKFPDCLFLPSSCKNFGNIDGDITVTYEIFVEIYRFGGLKNKPKRYLLYKVPIGWQSGVDPNLSKTITTLSYLKIDIFKDKLKKFYYDETTNALIPTSINKSHSSTKFIRKLWNNDYKSENYSNFTKSIPLGMDFSIRSIIELSEPFSSQISLKFNVDLKSIGIMDNKGKEFVFNGQSTKLGNFQIESLLIETNNSFSLQCNQYYMKEQSKNRIIKINFKELNMDIKDFQYNKMNEIFQYELPIEEISNKADIDINQSLMDIMGDNSIMCSGFVPNWFGNVVNFIITWTISDGYSQRRKYEFITKSMPDFLLGMDDTHNNNNSSSREPDEAPPVYEDIEQDMKI